MHKWMLLVLVAALLSGCSAGDDGQTQRAGMDLSTAQTATRPRLLAEEEILDAYDRAVQAYGWFELGTLSYTGEPREVDGTRYYRVDDPGFQELDELRTYLLTLFSEGVTERLLATGEEHPLYQDVDGALYTTGERRSQDLHKGNIQTEVIEYSDTHYEVAVTLDLLEEDQVTVIGVESWAFPYEFVDGRWVFTDFRLVY